MTYPSTVDSHRSFFRFITTFGFSSGCTQSRTTTSGTLVEGALMVASRVLPLPLAPTPLVSRKFDICAYVCIFHFVAEEREKLFTIRSTKTPLVGVVYRSRLPYFLCRRPSTLFRKMSRTATLSVMQPTRTLFSPACVVRVLCSRRNAVVGPFLQLYRVLVEKLRFSG